MPNYDFECNKCAAQEERFVSLGKTNRQKCYNCGGAMRIVIKQSAPPIFHEYFSENLGCMVTGPRQKARILKEKGLSESA
jgi:putative FmdB family regulatory protein